MARWLLALFVPAGPARDGLIGDLDELYADRRCEVGRARADLWYWSEVCNATWRYSIERVSGRGSGRDGGPASRRWQPIDVTRQDLRLALRRLRRTPGFSAVAMLTLALGIGGATTIFTVVDTVLLRPPPFEEPGRLVNVWTTYPHWRGAENLDAFWDRIALSFPEYEDLAANTRLFSGTAAYMVGAATVRGDGAPERLTAGLGTASLLDVLGVQMAAGRWFLPGEDIEGRRVVVLSDGFWKRRFGGDRDVLNRTITLDDEPFTVIGVLPAGFALRKVFPDVASNAYDAWLPIGRAGELTNRGNHTYDVIGRLAPGATLEAALAEATPLLRGDAPPERRGVRMAFREEVEVGALRSPLALLLAASGLLLLIACVNVATMSVGESLGRRPEIATRAALGAKRGRIVRQLLTESVLLGIGGAAAGALVALALVKLIVAVGPPLPVPRDLTFSTRVLLFASALGVGTGVLFGLAPAAVLRHAGLRSAIQRGVHSRRRGDRRIQDTLIVLEVALTVILLVGGGLLARTVANLLAIDPGYATDDIAVVTVSASAPRFTVERAGLALSGAMDNMRAAAAVERVSATNALPLSGMSGSTSLDIDGLPAPIGGGPGPEAQRRVVFPGYHEVLDIPLLAGRLLDERDAASAPAAMLVSDRFARIYWPRGSPLGARVRYDRRWWTIVGVVGDVRHGTLDEEPVATYYIPYAQHPWSTMTIVASTAIDARKLLPALREAVSAADPDLVITRTETMNSLVSGASAAERYRAIVILLFGVTAATLAVVGVFGATARSVARRSREIGVRLALGAGTRSLTGAIVANAALAGVAGVTAGLAGAAWTTRLLSGFLFGVDPFDPLTYALVAASLLAVTVFASWFAARRIERFDPVKVLRAQ